MAIKTSYKCDLCEKVWNNRDHISGISITSTPLDQYGGLNLAKATQYDLHYCEDGVYQASAIKYKIKHVCLDCEANLIDDLNIAVTTRKKCFSKGK